MASDSQILALSTMFAEDFFAFYGGRRRFGERAQVQTGRLFVVVLTLLAYVVALRAPETIFEIAIQYAFSGFAATLPFYADRPVEAWRAPSGRNTSASSTSPKGRPVARSTARRTSR